jgi:hypothetical protein
MEGLTGVFDSLLPTACKASFPSSSDIPLKAFREKLITISTQTVGAGALLLGIPSNRNEFAAPSAIGTPANAAGMIIPTRFALTTGICWNSEAS